VFTTRYELYSLSIFQFNLGLPWCLDAVPCVRGLFAYLSTHFNPRSVHVGFVVDKVARGQVFLLVSFHQCSIPMYITRRRDGRSRGTLKYAVALIGENCVQTYLHSVLRCVMPVVLSAVVKLICVCVYVCQNTTELLVEYLIIYINNYYMFRPYT
jgi:hypothetical protein